MAEQNSALGSAVANLQSAIASEQDTHDKATLQQALHLCKQVQAANALQPGASMALNLHPSNKPAAAPPAAGSQLSPGLQAALKKA